VLFALAFPPFRLIIPVFVCLVPLAVGIGRLADNQVGSAARIGFWFAILGFGANLYWIGVALMLFTQLAWAGYVATVFCLGVIYAVACALLYTARRRTRWPMAILLPPIWVASEMLLVHLGDIAFPWLPLGLGVATQPHLAQLADLSGVHGLSLWIAVINGLLADAVLTAGGQRVRRIALAAVAVVVLWAYGSWRLATTHLRPLAPVAAVQPNVPEDEKLQASLRTKFMTILTSATRDSLAHAAERPALIVWPEVALPDYLQQRPDWGDSLRALAAITHAPLVFGILDVTFRSSRDYDIYNAAMVADSTGVVGAQPAYHKRYLVPIVERVPFVDPKWFDGMKYFGAFGRGGTPIPFKFSFGSAGVIVCYESIFADLARTYRREGADLLLNITNDAWFGETSAPYQHSAHLRLRAIENRVGVVRAANTGISEYVDPLGRVHGPTRLGVQAVRVYDTETTDVHTLYDAWGDWVGLLSVAAVLLLALASWPRSPRSAPR
jgi:apolipoprotein N-acyltransferase